ncbi:alpha/beta hydrolase [Phytohabitans flavus]|uniref:Alpha/beta hydrolase n=1 Tax=Phytohabitans flavus TaxID=1076124 RepID=A0A6F8XNN9_9ACTN|nr:alpha/beta hydrolase [Phytohabitans flavus]
MAGGLALIEKGSERMAISGYPIPVTERAVHANGIDFWYVEAGAGVPLLLLHGGTVSNGPLWTGHKYGWGAHLAALAKHFHVIALDTRGHGRTRNPSGELSYRLYAEDLLAVIEALELDRPLIAGFSDGGTTATILGMIAPEVPRAIVDYAGYQTFNPDPDASNYRRLRNWFGGSPNATKLDYDHFSSDLVDPQRHIDDFEPTQGAGYFRTYIEQIFTFWTKPMEFTYADYPRITAPMLMLVGDRDPSCSLADGVELYQKLPQGELGVVPGACHEVTSLGRDMMLDYLRRHQD